MTTRAVWLALGLLSGLPAAADDVDPLAKLADRCREVIAADPSESPLAALRRAESEQMRTARAESRAGRKRLRESIGQGPGERARALTAGFANASDSYWQAISRARTLCDCRESLGDPHRQDCDALYRPYLPPSRH